jgi:undecaprenyl-diphosphatase
MNIIQELDTWFFAFINNFAGKWMWLDAMARLFLNDYFVPTLMAITLLLVWFDGTNHVQRTLNRRAVLVGALSAALANIALKMMNLLYHRPRPFEAVKATLLFYHPTDSSFPSNAATLGFSIAAGVWIYRQRWGWVMLGVAAIFGLSRVFGGVHYPLDVIAGATLGCLSAWIIHKQKTLTNLVLALILWMNGKVGLP